MNRGERIKDLNLKAVQQGRYILLWLQASVRASCNHAPEYAIEQANKTKKPVVACFALTTPTPTQTNGTMPSSWRGSRTRGWPRRRFWILGSSFR